MADRLDNLDESSLIEEIKSLRNDVNQIKTDQLIKTNKFNIRLTGEGITPIATLSTTSKIVGFNIADNIIPHNLGYTPIIMGFITGWGGVNQSILMPYFSISGGSGIRTVTETYMISADDTNIYLTSVIQYVSNVAESNVFATTTYSVKYYILEEAAKDN